MNGSPRRRSASVRIATNCAVGIRLSGLSTPADPRRQRGTARLDRVRAVRAQPGDPRSGGHPRSLGCPVRSSVARLDNTLARSARHMAGSRPVVVDMSHPAGAALDGSGSLPGQRDRSRTGVLGGGGGFLSEGLETTRVRVTIRPNAMPDPAAGRWLVLHVAARCLENGSLRTFWPELERHAAHAGLCTRGTATLVWLGLLLAVPLLAERRRRLVARTLEATMRSIVRGEQMSAAVDRGVGGLVRRGAECRRRLRDGQRLLGRIPLRRSKGGHRYGPRHHDHGGGDALFPAAITLLRAMSAKREAGSLNRPRRRPHSGSQFRADRAAARMGGNAGGLT